VVNLLIGLVFLVSDLPELLLKLAFKRQAAQSPRPAVLLFTPLTQAARLPRLRRLMLSIWLSLVVAALALVPEALLVLAVGQAVI
jgi:hypothetical protein